MIETTSLNRMILIMYSMFSIPQKGQSTPKNGRINTGVQEIFDQQTVTVNNMRSSNRKCKYANYTKNLMLTTFHWKKQRIIDQTDQNLEESFGKSKLLDRQLFRLNGNGGHHDLLESPWDGSISKIVKPPTSSWTKPKSTTGKRLPRAWRRMATLRAGFISEPELLLKENLTRYRTSLNWCLNQLDRMDAVRFGLGSVFNGVRLWTLPMDEMNNGFINPASWSHPVVIHRAIDKRWWWRFCTGKIFLIIQVNSTPSSM